MKKWIFRGLHLLKYEFDHCKRVVLLTGNIAISKNVKTSLPTWSYCAFHFLSLLYIEKTG